MDMKYVPPPRLECMQSGNDILVVF